MFLIKEISTKIYTKLFVLLIQFWLCTWSVMSINLNEGRGCICMGVSSLISGVRVSNSFSSWQPWLEASRTPAWKALEGKPTAQKEMRSGQTDFPPAVKFDFVHRKSMKRIWAIFSSSTFHSNYSLEVAWFNFYAFSLGWEYNEYPGLCCIKCLGGIWHALYPILGTGHSFHHLCCLPSLPLSVNSH